MRLRIASLGILRLPVGSMPTITSCFAAWPNKERVLSRRINEAIKEGKIVGKRLLRRGNAVPRVCTAFMKTEIETTSICMIYGKNPIIGEFHKRWKQEERLRYAPFHHCRAAR